MLASRPGALVALLALAGCGTRDLLPPPDVLRYDARDTVVIPRRDGATDVATDAAPVVDVTVFDAPAHGDAGFNDLAAVADATGGCQALAEDYAAAVRDAQSCLVGGNCSTLVCETLCCACQVYVNTATAAYPRVLALRDRWERERCPTPPDCPRVPCPPPSSAECSSDSRCVTLRATSADGGGPLP